MLCSDSDSSDSDIDLLFLENCFAPEKVLGPRINLQDVSEMDRERMFRYFWTKSDNLANYHKLNLAEKNYIV